MVMRLVVGLLARSPHLRGGVNQGAVARRTIPKCEFSALCSCKQLVGFGWNFFMSLASDSI